MKNFVGPEEYRHGENSLEAGDDSSVVPAVSRKMKEPQHINGTGEVHGGALLLRRKRGDPDGD